MAHNRYIAWLVAGVVLLALLPGSAARAQPPVAEPFRDYYAQHEGLRVLGRPLTGLIDVYGYPAQYFEKGRIEDHRDEVDNPEWAFMYGRVTAELLEIASNCLVSATSMTYAQLRLAANPQARRSAPAGFTGGMAALAEGVFVPHDSQLRSAPGYIVPTFFWDYINRAELFPGGWLHDTGLPLTAALPVKVYKNGELRTVTLQAFERAVLTYDPLNPAEWQVERGNIGADSQHRTPAFGTIEIPAAKARVTLPLHILARVGQPGDQMTATLRWENGVELTETYPILRGENGGGLLIVNLDWAAEPRGGRPWTQAATLELYDWSGAVLARQELTVLSPDDPDTRSIKLFWVVGETLRSEERHIPRAPGAAAAALNELLWGPMPRNRDGFSTALPTPEEVLRYRGRRSDWGPQVTLRSLTVQDGVTVADFSPELRAYGGGSLRASLIHGQITRTLLQFSSIQDTRITIAGEPERLLEPSGGRPIN
jgi:hypothetical protein